VLGVTKNNCPGVLQVLSLQGANTSFATIERIEKFEVQFRQRAQRQPAFMLFASRN